MTKDCERGSTGANGGSEGEGASDKTWWWDICKKSFLDKARDETRSRQNGLGVRE